MNKIFLGAVFGLTIMGSAGASIISRGFFDEQIGNYATLDLLNSKANQKDLTALSDRIGVRNWSIDNGNLLIDSFPFTKELFPDLYGGGDSWVVEDAMPMSHYFELNNASTLWPGLAGVTDKLLNGWRNSDGETYLGLKDVNTKIGVLPKKYQTVGAALSAIEGIAEEAKTLAEKAIPDPRAEGSSGKFVLTVDVIGDNATYHWEKIDRTSDETQTVSE